MSPSQVPPTMNLDSRNGTNNFSTTFAPIAICGMACRLPGGIRSPQQLWDLLMAKGDARTRVPESRYNADAYYSPTVKPGTTKSQHGYFLEEDLTRFDPSLFSMSPMELERADPQQKLLLEVSRECIEDAGEVNWRGAPIGVYIGTFGEDWCDMFDKEPQQYGVYRISGTGDYALANRISYEMNLQGPSMTVRTACSAALVGLNEACLAINRGDCKSAIVGGTSLILCPSMTAKMTEQGILAPDASCKTFSSDANGYGRGEAINAIYIKPIDDAIKDGNPIRAVIRATATNSDGKTPGITFPSIEAQESLIRHTYKLAGITDFSETAFIECHGTGTPVGDPIETKAIARIFGDRGVYIGSVKPNLGHSEGASGLTSIIKSVLALENRTIPPNIKFNEPNPNIPFKEAKLTVPTEPQPWPDREDRISINSFGIGGSNAHVILDSSASHGLSLELKEAPYTPQLLVYSANSSESLNKIVGSYSQYLANFPERIVDIAFTLAHKRETLSHRAFVVASREQPGTISPITKPGPAPNIVMVFTGQGAQWPQMGRDLIKSNFVFRETIASLDAYLQTLGEDAPEWKVEEELCKSAKKSRLSAAEFAQPLCTAIQIGIVDVLASIGIVPTAVVGHSSGEIAGAYASGALTAKEAIITAFYRGAITKLQTRIGAMAAVGLGWKAVEPYLASSSGVVVACENSPRSVTISGDADAVTQVITNIQKARPDVLARLLKVDKAYHSHHMTEIGEAYYQLIAPKLAREPPLKPFFSSVTGKVIAKDEFLDSKYWQQNLESPVLFQTAVSNIIRDSVGRNAVFLEIGPHSALAGPLRQILTEASSNAPYIPTMLRNQSCSETLLSAIGKLYTLNSPVNMKALIPNGTCLPDLPRYQWNHSGRYWHETRMTREWRLRKYPYHDLLGFKSLECTDFEPIWRNLFHLDNAPWVRDHKIMDDVVFPFAAYISMAGEAMRQVSGIQEGFKARNVAVSTALVLTEGNPVELVTTFRQHRLMKRQESVWWAFTISSHNGHTWTKHCVGEVAAMTEGLGLSDVEDINKLPRAVDSQKWYNMFRKCGIAYGPSFQGLENIKSSSCYPGRSTATLCNGRNGDESQYFLHPALFDTVFQLVACAASLGISRKHRKILATNVGELCISRCASDVSVNVSASYTTNGSIIGSGQCTAEGRVVLHMTGVKLTLLDEPEANDAHTAARHAWGPLIDFLTAGDLIKPTINHAQYTPALDELARLCLLYSQHLLAGIPSSPHLQEYYKWMRSQIQVMDHCVREQLESENLLERIDALVDRLSKTPASSAALALRKVATSLSSIFTAEQEALDILHEDDVFENLQRFVNSSDISTLLQHLAHSKPNLRVLELCVGTGSSTGQHLAQLTLPGNLPLYSKYTLSDPSPSNISFAKERFMGIPNVEFITLDINNDLMEQAFESREYDLVMVPNNALWSDHLLESLKNVHMLLQPEGRLLLHELCPNNLWINYVFGIFPFWRLATDDRPYFDKQRWEAQLRSAGFGGIDAFILDSEEPFQLNSVIIAKPEIKKTAMKQVTLLCVDHTSDSEPIMSGLQSRGYKVTRCTLNDIPLAGQDVISLLDMDTPFFQELTASTYEALKRFICKLDDSGLFWITCLSPVRCTTPQYAQVLGFARTIRSEMGINFAVCQTDGQFSDSTVLDVFTKFHGRSQDIGLKPEMEYAIYEQQVHVGRFYPFKLTDEMLISAENDKSVLEIERPGRLTELHWVHQPAEPPTGDNVEIEIYSVGLNHRDVLAAKGDVELSQPSLGIEAAGVIHRCGPNVTDFEAGDRVILFGHNALSSSITVSQLLCAKIPDVLSFNDAATMPFGYMTALHSLVDIGRLEKEQTALIHNGCSDIGLAAIQLAKFVGADVYTTVMNEDQAQYLASTFNLPPSRVFYSTHSSFVDEIMRETAGKGVDLVLNSYSSDFLQETWRCIAEFGKMIEIGPSSDPITPEKLDSGFFTRSRTYSYVDITNFISKKPLALSRLLSSIVSLFNSGDIRPIHQIKILSSTKVQDAFRYLEEGPVTGKILVEVRQPSGSSHVEGAAMERKRIPSFDSSSSYLLVGGLGGLGRAISTWMVEHGARHLIYLSRTAGTRPNDQAFLHELESMGCSVQVVKGSVTDIDDVTRAINGAVAPLKGILHMSMVLRDQAFPKMSWDDWHAAVSPKVQGTWNLHNATLDAGVKLDFFILFSSLSGIIGQLGQANYASANTFLDAFCQYRSELGLAASAIDIGAMEDIGFIAEKDDLLRQMKSTGFFSLKEKELLDAIIVAMHPPPSSSSLRGTVADRSTFVLGLASTFPLDSTNNRTIWRQDPRMAVYHNLGTSTTESRGTTNTSLKSFLAGARDDPELLKTTESTLYLAGEIGRKLFGLLMKPDEDLNISLSLTDLGMDSLVAIEMRMWWKQVFGFNISVLEMLGMGTLEALAKYTTEKLIKGIQGQ